MKKLNLLAIDASSYNLSFCITRGGKTIVDFNRKIKFGASQLISYIDKVFKKAPLALRDIDAFVIGAGPGSFTGLRVSFSIIKAFAIAGKKPIIAVGSFLSCAYPFKDKEEKIAVVSDARRNLIYFGCFKSKGGIFKKEGREKLAHLEELKDRKGYLFITYDSHIREQALNINPDINFYPKDVYPKAKHFLSLAGECYAKEKFISVDKLKPVYLHPKTCQVRK
ncbi:MAG: tRNA (adenosine(37)-N6)-threonylcarbamoyltransferase complex dimerization subunit type 1 TsaB [Candidatus Omnitrophota bacterium]